MAKQITEHKVRSLAGRETRYRITEDNLQVEVQPSGLKSWYCQGRADGKRFRKKLGEYPAMSVKEAREAVRKVLHERDEGIRIIEDPSSFAAFVEGPFRDWCESSRKQGVETMKRIRFSHLPVFGDKKLRSVTQRDIELHKARLLRTKANATVKRELGDLRRVFSKAVEWKMLRENPADHVSDPKVERAEKLYLSDDEVDRLHEALDEWKQKADAEWRSKGLPVGKRAGIRYSHNPDLAPLIRLLMNTGLRRSEALSLRWSDLSIDNGHATLTVRPEIAKSGRRRVIPVNTKLVDVLMPSMGLSDEDAKDFWRKQLRARGNDQIFAALQNPEKAWQRLRKSAGLDHVTLHTLRHHFASQLVLRGVALHVVSKLLGHSSLEVTQIYLSVRRDDEIEAVELL
ncbi:MAG: site-specific integrase [Pseudomonadota bacterium]